MRSLHWSWLLLFAVACGGADPDSRGDGSADAVATYHGGEVTLSEIEAAFPEARTPACLAARRARGGGSVEELVPCYAEVAEGLVLERLALAEVDDPTRAMRELESYPVLRRHAYLEAFGERQRDEIEITDDAVEAFYEANRDRYRRPGSLSLWNIFRRHENPDRPEETLEFLRELKARYEAGETFTSLARAHSQSETRQRGGQVGSVPEGRLPARLEEVAFALGDGDVSDPVPVRGGAVLLHVRNVVRGTDLTLTEVEAQIRQQLRAEAVAEAIEKIVAEVEAPDGSVILDSEALLAALDGDDLEAPVLDIDGDVLAVGQARLMIGLAEGVPIAELEEERRDQLLEVYEQRRQQALLAFHLQATADDDLRAEAEEHVLERGTQALVDQRLRTRMETAAAVDAETLETYYRDNLPHYQSALRFHVHIWDLPFGSDPPGQLARMEELRESLVTGEVKSLAAAVDRLGGSVRDLGFRELGELPELTGKAREYLLQTEAGSFSIPFQDDESLHLLWVEAREEPRPLSYEKAAERVRADYLRRFEEQLFRQMAEAWLAENGFHLDQDRLTAVLSGDPSSAEAAV